MKEKRSDYRLDISKYVVAGIVISSIFDLIDDKPQTLIYGVIIAFLLLIVSLKLTENE